MPAAITITDEASLTLAQGDRSFTLVLPHHLITVRELIEQRVRAEVDAYNQARPEIFRGLVRPMGAEPVPGGCRPYRFRVLDWREQVNTALRAFQTGGIAILINGRQAGSLFDRIALTPETKITFFQLAPLVGG